MTGPDATRGRAWAFRAAGWLSLAATPFFAIMALLTAVTHAPPAELFCSPTAHRSPLDGMTLMYVLMSVIHLPPWMRLFAGERRRLTPDG